MPTHDVKIFEHLAQLVVDRATIGVDELPTGRGTGTDFVSRVAELTVTDGTPGV